MIYIKCHDKTLLESILSPFNGEVLRIFIYVIF